MNIQFYLNNQKQSLVEINPNTSLLQWLRANQLSGCKEGCAEGDCGACTVVLAELDWQDNLQLKTINACIAIMPTLHGKAIYTVEYLRQKDGSLHPVQQAMIDCHASQCGFCTPGFVMSLFALYNSTKQANSNDIESALSGNLCRCTGYRPILEAASKMYDYPRIDFAFEQLGEDLKQLNACATPEAKYFTYQYQDYRYDAPRTIAELVQLRQQFPQATILAGGTDIGLWLTKKLINLKHLIYLGEIKELQQINCANDRLYIGAAANLNQAFAALCDHYPQLDEMWQRFASLPIRNTGTMGGNVANGSPIGDSMPVLIALAAQVQLNSVAGPRIMALEDFYLGYQQKAWHANEIVSAIIVPLSSDKHFLRNYKVAKRYNSDISAVCAAFYLQFAGETVIDCRFAFGGMAATSKRATICEAALRGQKWNEENVKKAMLVLADDFSPLSDMRASAKYRQQVAANLLYRCFIESKQEEQQFAGKSQSSNGQQINQSNLTSLTRVF